METRNDKHYKWVMLGLLAFTYFLMHATRQVFNASFTDIKASLPGPTDAQWGFTRTAFLFAYGLAVPLAGIAADMLRRKWVVVVGALLFSLSVFGTGYVDGFVGMLVMYGLFNGIGQCMIPASASSLIAQYHTETRSTALSIYQTGLYFGIILASALAGWFSSIAADGWRWGFWGFGAVGVAWTVALMFLLRDTPPLVKKGGDERASFKDAALAMVSKPTALLLTFAFGMLVFGSNCFRTFLPHFMRQAQAENERVMANVRRQQSEMIREVKTVDNPLTPGEQIERPIHFDHSWINSTQDAMMLSDTNLDPHEVRKLVGRGAWTPVD